MLIACIAHRILLELQGGIDKRRCRLLGGAAIAERIYPSFYLALLQIILTGLPMQG